MRGIDPLHRDFLACVTLELDLAPFASIKTAAAAAAFFLAGSPDEDNAVRLWRSDGTSSGTTLVRDINAGSGLNPFKNLLTRTAPPVRVRGVINHAETVLSEFVHREIKVRRQSEQPGQERLVG